LKGKPIVQLERAAGAAIEFFNNSKGINVPRSRFLPVKGTGDLLIVQSNLYSLQHGTLIMNPARPFAAVPLVKLGPEFTKVPFSIIRRSYSYSPAFYLSTLARSMITRTASKASPISWSSTT